MPDNDLPPANVGTFNYTVDSHTRTLSRACLGCFEDWTGSDDPFCPACSIERMMRLRVKGNWRSDFLDPVDWWGPNQNDIDPGDIADGFSEVNPFEPADDGEW